MAETDPVETAWRIHTALVDWTGKVDAKAGFALTLESAVIGAIVAFSKADHHPVQADGTAPRMLFWLGAALLGASAVASVSVVSPRLRAGERQDRREHFVYFGDLRHWEPERLSEALRTTSPLTALSHQLVDMSEIAWTKHRRVRQSLVLAMAGVLVIALAWLLG
jgi:hypothetical protein